MAINVKYTPPPVNGIPQSPVTVNCDLIRGRASVLKEKCEVWESPGIDGYGAQKLGKCDAPFEFSVVWYGSKSYVEGQYVALCNAQGNLGEINDDWLSQHLNLLFVQVGDLSRTPAIPFECRGETLIRGVRTGTHLAPPPP